jgi:hypothetical protein
MVPATMVVVMAVVMVGIEAPVIVIGHRLCLQCTDLWRTGYNGNRLVDDGDLALAPSLSPGAKSPIRNSIEPLIWSPEFLTKSTAGAKRQR